MTSAPDPVLGLHADPATAGREQRLEAFGRAAMRFAVTGAFAFAVELVAFGVTLWQRLKGLSSHVTKGEVLLLSFAFLVWFICHLVGLALGVYARRTKEGKAALITALVPYGVLLLLAVGFFTLGLLNRTVPSPP